MVAILNTAVISIVNTAVILTQENVGTVVNYSSIFMRLSSGLSTIKLFFLAIDDVLEK
jgi:hypothetical protein